MIAGLIVIFTFRMVSAQTNPPVEVLPKQEVETTETLPEGYSVTLEPEQVELLALATTSLRAAHLKIRLAAYGSVLDPTPLLMLDGDLASASAALAVSQAEYDRTRTLVASNDASIRTEQAARAQYLTDQIRVEGLRRSALLQWDKMFPEDEAERGRLAQSLLAGTSALARVDLLPGDTLAETPTDVSISVIGRDTTPIAATQVTPATTTDPRAQSQSYLVRIDGAPFSLRPGMALTAWLTPPGEPVEVFAIPRSAILRHDGRTWIYLDAGGTFLRRPIKLLSPLDGTDAWLAIGDHSELREGDALVVTGAASLLSEEMRSLGGTDDEE